MWNQHLALTTKNIHNDEGGDEEEVEELSTGKHASGVCTSHHETDPDDKSISSKNTCSSSSGRSNSDDNEEVVEPSKKTKFKTNVFVTKGCCGWFQLTTFTCFITE